MSYTPHVPRQRTRIRRWSLQLTARSWHSLAYVSLSLPHTASVDVSSDVTMTSQCVMQRHVALPVFSSTTHSAANAQNFRSHDSEQSAHASTFMRTRTVSLTYLTLKLQQCATTATNNNTKKNVYGTEPWWEFTWFIWWMRNSAKQTPTLAPS